MMAIPLSITMWSPLRMLLELSLPETNPLYVPRVPVRFDKDLTAPVLVDLAGGTWELAIITWRFLNRGAPPHFKHGGTDDLDHPTLHVLSRTRPVEDLNYSDLQGTLDALAYVNLRWLRNKCEGDRADFSGPAYLVPGPSRATGK